uniref:Uncharacterized protein n=1 Tax=Psilocybe cubensis TaxID=181762 RepID=A0A8H8CFI4_PSICU
MGVDQSYPSTSFTGVAPEDVQRDQYIDIVHGGIWFADADPSAQVANTLTRAEMEDEERKRQLIPTRSSVEQLVSYSHRGSHSGTQANFNDRFHFNIGEKESTYTIGSMQITSNSEGSSGGNPVEPFAQLGHRDGGTTNHHSTAQNSDRQVASASKNSRKRRLSTEDKDGSTSAPAEKRPRKRSPRDPLRDQKVGKGRVARALTAAPTRRPHRKPATPRCMAGPVSEGHVVVHDRERHSKKGTEFTFQVMSAAQRP